MIAPWLKAREPAYPLGLLIESLDRDGTCYVLGAGASAPHVPTMAELPARVAAYARQLGSFPAGPIPDSPLRQLVAPMIELALEATTIEAWRAGAMTPATIAFVLERLISAAHWTPLPQYRVFSLLPAAGTVVSFNWDGLAGTRCAQSVVHPHGTIRPRLLSPEAFDETLEFGQLYDDPNARELILPELILPGEEELPRSARARERVFTIWREAAQVVIVGYSFGLRSRLRYDRMWLDTFVEALTVNADAAVHVIDPEAAWLRGELAERLRRTVNVHAWPFRWHALASALLSCARSESARRVGELRVHPDTFERLYLSTLERSSAAMQGP